jgi:GNAT superfamily N-acetyltransferase
LFTIGWPERLMPLWCERGGDESWPVAVQQAHQAENFEPPRCDKTGGVGVLIRDANDSDIEVLSALFRRSSLSNIDDRAALLKHPELVVFSGLAVSRGQVRVALDVMDRAVGFVTAISVGEMLEIEDLFVDPDRMRQGIGRLLIDDVETDARALGVARIEVTANPHSLAFYLAVGFVHDREVQTQLGAGHRMHLDVRP